MVFQHRREVEHAEQWCFSIVKKNDEGLLTMVFQQRKNEKAKQLLDGLFRQ
jgi:hypothetical protein